MICTFIFSNEIFLFIYIIRFKSDEERTPVYRIVEETFPPLLNIFSRLVQIPNPTLEVADLIKLICKIFWSSIYVCSGQRFFHCASVVDSSVKFVLVTWILMGDTYPFFNKPCAGGYSANSINRIASNPTF